MFGAVAKLFHHKPHAKIEALAQQIVEQSLEDSVRRVADHLEGMSLSEARGYVRARAAQVVRKHTQVAINRQPKAMAAWSHSITTLATERIIPLVLRKSGVGMPRTVAPERLAA